jgi:hypothetical protein
VDNSPSSHAEDTGEKENTGGEHCSNPKAERGRDAAKSIHYRAITRLARLRVFRKVAGKHFGYAYLQPRHVRGLLERDVFFPSKIRDVKLETYSTFLHTFVVRLIFHQFFKRRRENRIPVKSPNPLLLARNIVSANSIETRSGQPSRLFNNQGSKRR